MRKTKDDMERARGRKSRNKGERVLLLAKDLWCTILCPRASHTHSTKTTAEIPLGYGEVGVSHVLINGSLILLSQYRKPQKSLKSTHKGHHQRQQEGVREVRGPRGETVRYRE